MLSAHPDCSYGKYSLPVGCPHVHSHGLEPTCSDYHHIDRYHYLFDAGRIEGSHLGGCHSGVYPDRWCCIVSWHPDVFHARGTDADFRTRRQLTGR